VATINSGLGPILSFISKASKHPDLKYRSYVFGYRQLLDGSFLHVLGVTSSEFKAGDKDLFGMVMVTDHEHTSVVGDDSHPFYTSDVLGQALFWVESETFIDFVNNKLGVGDYGSIERINNELYYHSNAVNTLVELGHKEEEAYLYPLEDTFETDFDFEFFSRARQACSRSDGYTQYPFAFRRTYEEGGVGETSKFLKETPALCCWAMTNGWQLVHKYSQTTNRCDNFKVDGYWLKCLSGRAFKDIQVLCKVHTGAMHTVGNLVDGTAFIVGNGPTVSDTPPGYKPISEIVYNSAPNYHWMTDEYFVREGSYINEDRVLKSIPLNIIKDALRSPSKWGNKSKNLHNLLIITRHDASPLAGGAQDYIVSYACLIKAAEKKTGTDFGKIEVDYGDENTSTLESVLWSSSVKVPAQGFGDVIGDDIILDSIKASEECWATGISEQGYFYWTTCVQGRIIKDLLDAYKGIEENYSLWFPFYSRSSAVSVGSAPLMVTDDTCKIPDGGISYVFLPVRRSGIELSEEALSSIFSGT
jgi:hypothetical protein